MLLDQYPDFLSISIVSLLKLELTLAVSDIYWWKLRIIFRKLTQSAFNAIDDVDPARGARRFFLQRGAKPGTIAPIFLANVNSSSCSLFVIDGPSVSVVCLSVCLSSVTLVRPTQTNEIFGNISTPCGTLAIHELCVKILPRSSQGNPSVGGVKQ